MIKRITLNDRIYGECSISSLVIIDLLSSKPLQRLKKIGQYGVPDEFYYLKNYSRFEHSVGVFILLKLLGASEQEQIGGLLHDVSHTVFSHVIDFAFGKTKTHNYQDLHLKNYIVESEIPNILKKYNYDMNTIINYENFNLLEKPIPNLCADRIDYALREFPKNIISECLHSLKIVDNNIVFNNQQQAFLFASNYLRQFIKNWGSFESVARYYLLGEALNIALKEKILYSKDLWSNDQHIITKLKESQNTEINKILMALRKKRLLNLPKSDTIVHTKFRYVDPEFISNHKLVRLSSVDKEFKEVLEKVRLENEKGFSIPAI